MEVPRKAMFTPHQIGAAWMRLQALGWLNEISAPQRNATWR